MLKDFLSNVPHSLRDTTGLLVGTLIADALFWIVGHFIQFNPVPTLWFPAPAMLAAFTIIVSSVALVKWGSFLLFYWRYLK